MAIKRTASDNGHLWQGLKPNTIQTYRQGLNRIVNHFQISDVRNTRSGGRTDEETLEYIISNINDENLSEYLQASLDSGLRPEYISTSLQAVKWSFKHKAKSNKFFDKSSELLRLAIKVPYVIRDRHPGLYWTDVDIIVHSISEDKSMAGYRDKALVKVLSNCLLRVSEAVEIDVNDVRALAIHYDGYKLPITLSTKRSIQNYKRIANIESGPLFRNSGRGFDLSEDRITIQRARRALSKRLVTAGYVHDNNGKRYTGGSFRIGSILELLKSNEPLCKIQELARYKRITGLVTYISDHNSIINAQSAAGG